MRNILFGVKDKFAIEVGDYKHNSKKGRLRFWINGNTIGDFKKNHTLSYAATSLKKLTDIHKDLYDISFLGKTEREIFINSLLIGTNRDSFTAEDYKIVEKYQKFSPFFGDQFDSVTCLVYIKDNKIHFLWTLVKDFVSTDIDYLKNLNFSEANISDFMKAVNLFLSFLGESSSVGSVQQKDGNDKKKKKE